MFTVEIESSATVITVMDENNSFEDVQIIVQDDDGVVIRQFDEERELHDCVFLTYDMLVDVYAALSSPEGIFVTERIRRGANRTL